MKQKQISWQAVTKEIDQPNTILADLRDRRDYMNCHIKGAVSLPYRPLLRGRLPLSKQTHYLVYCHQGITSQTVANEMNLRGYHFTSIEGGIQSFLKDHKGYCKDIDES